MRIDFDRYFSFYKPGRDPWVEAPLAAPTHLSDILAGLGIPIAEVHFVIVNGEARNPKDVILSEGDRVKLFPPFGGG